VRKAPRRCLGPCWTMQPPCSLASYHHGPAS
jgi:hypothetical protein